jgi:citrate lyase synthetase
MIDHKTLQREYGGKFVAIMNDEKIVASGNTFNETIAKIQAMNMANKAGISIRFVRPCHKDGE